MVVSSRRVHSGSDPDGSGREALKTTRRSYRHKLMQWALAAAVGAGVHMVGLQGVVLAQVQAAQVSTPLTASSLSTLDANFRRSWNDAVTELRNNTTSDTPNPVLTFSNGRARALVDRLVEISVRAASSGHPEAAVPGLRVANSNELSGPGGQTYYRDMLTAVLTYFNVSRNPPTLTPADLSDANLNRVVTGPLNALTVSLQASSLAGVLGSTPPTAALAPEVIQAREAFAELTRISGLLTARNRARDETNPYRYLTPAEAARANTRLVRIKNQLDDLPGVTGAVPTSNPTLNQRQQGLRTTLLTQYHDLVNGQNANSLTVVVRTAQLRHDGSGTTQVDTTGVTTFASRAERLRQILTPLSTQTQNAAVARAATAAIAILGDQSNAQALLNVSDVNIPGSNEYSGNRSRILDCLIRVAATISGRTEDALRDHIYRGAALAAPTSAPNLDPVAAQMAAAERIRAGDQAFMRNFLVALRDNGYPAIVAEAAAFPDAAAMRQLDTGRRVTNPVYRSFRVGQATVDNSRAGVVLTLGGRSTVLNQYLRTATVITPESFAFFYERFISAADVIHRTATFWAAGVAIAGSPTPEMMRSYASMATHFVRPDDAAARRSVDARLLPTLRQLIGPNATDADVYRTLGTNRDFVQVGDILNGYTTVGYLSQLVAPLSDQTAEERANRVARLRAARVGTSFEYGPILAGRLPNLTPTTPAPAPVAARAPRRRGATAQAAPTEVYRPVSLEDPVRLERATMVLQNARDILRGQTQSTSSVQPRLLEIANAWLTQAQHTNPPAASATAQEKETYRDFCNNIFHLSNALLAIEEASIRLTVAENNHTPNAPALRASFTEVMRLLNEDFSPEHMDVGPTYLPTLPANIADDITRQCNPLLAAMGYSATAFTERSYRLARTGATSPTMAQAVEAAAVGTAGDPGPELRNMRLLELTAATGFTQTPLAVASTAWGTSVTALDPRFRLTSASTVYTLPDVNISQIDIHPPGEPHDQVRYYPYGPTSVELLRQAHQVNDINAGIANDDTSPFLRTYVLRTPMALTPNLASGTRDYTLGTLFMDAASASDVEATTNPTMSQRMREANVALTNLLRVRTARLAQRLHDRLPTDHPAFATAGETATIGDLERRAPGQPEALHYRIRRARETLAWAEAQLAGGYTTSADRDLSVPGVTPLSLRQANAAVERVLADLSDRNVDQIPYVPRPSVQLTNDPWVEVLDRYNLEFVRWDSSETTNDEGDRIVLAQAYVRPRNSPNSEPISLQDWINNHPRSDPTDHANDLAVVRRAFSRAATMYTAFNVAVGSEYMLLGRNSGSTYVGHLVRGVTLNVPGRAPQTVDAYVAIEPASGGPILRGYREVTDNGRPRILFYVRPESTGAQSTGTLEPIIADDGSLARNYDQLFNSSPASAPDISTLFVENVVFRPVVFIQRNRDNAEQNRR